MASGGRPLAQNSGLDITALVSGAVLEVDFVRSRAHETQFVHARALPGWTSRGLSLFVPSGTCFRDPSVENRTGLDPRAA